MCSSAIDRPIRPLLELENPVRPYVWGSLDFIPELLGVPPSGEPAAEMWIGAHPTAPSRVPLLDSTLLDLIAAAPEATLGVETMSVFGARLPFLVKILAAASPLSIQTHPTWEQAQAGHLAENSRGLAGNDPGRSYPDANHKPELICALTDFDALVGFRDISASADLLRTLVDHGAELLAGKPGRLIAHGGLRALVTEILTAPASKGRELLDSVIPACVSVAAQGGRWSVECATAAELAEMFPGDAGAVLALLLNRVRLTPGEAMFLSAGRIHAYLRGAGVEVMASSDNVLRCGLTAKHVDVAELLRVLDFTTDDARPVRAVSDGLLLRYPAPVGDFVLSLAELAAGDRIVLPAAGPRIVLCTGGTVRLSAIGAEDYADEMLLTSGRAAFLAAGYGLALAGPGRVFVTTTDPAR